MCDYFSILHQQHVLKLIKPSVLIANPPFSHICLSILSSPPSLSLYPGGGGAAFSGEGPGREAGDAEDEADGGQGQAEGAGEAQDPAGATAGVEEQDAGAAGRAAEATQRGQEGEEQQMNE